MTRSVLDDLGQEVTGIAAPVAICMAITIALVRLLNPEGSSDANAVFLASIYYSENEGDSTGQKLSGSVINALIFVGVIAFMTFVMVLLFKYGCTRFIFIYMALSGFSIFFLLTGIIAIELLQLAGAHMDWISFTYLLFNFAMVGALTMFYAPAPLFLKQVYLVVTGVVTAYVFTWIPEWTTWVLLVAMALYDIVAVLVPGGPLKMLVELAQEREEELPALVYQARGSGRPTPAPPGLDRIHESEQPPPPQPDTPLIPTMTPRSQESFETEVASEIFDLPDAIKLGLGDFIFYSVLVGRAAMYDYLTVFACFIAIIAGLGCTLLWLAVAHKALPALPISIALAVVFYFVSRFVMEPVILPMTLALVYF